MSCVLDVKIFSGAVGNTDPTRASPRKALLPSTAPREGELSVPLPSGDTVTSPRKKETRELSPKPGGSFSSSPVLEGRQGVSFALPTVTVLGGRQAGTPKIPWSATAVPWKRDEGVPLVVSPRVADNSYIRIPLAHGRQPASHPNSSQPPPQREEKKEMTKNKRKRRTAQLIRQDLVLHPPLIHESGDVNVAGD